MSDGPTPNTDPQPQPPTSAPSGPTVHSPRHNKPKEEGGFWHGASRVVQIILSPLIYLLRPLVFRVSQESGNPKVSFTSFSGLMYLWPIMAVGWLGILLFPIVRPEVLGWAWITTVLVVLITVASDVDRNKLLVLVGLIAILWMGGFILQSNQHIPVLSHVYDYFAGQDVSFNKGMANVMSIIVAIILLGVVIVGWFDGRFEITTREITHKRVFRTSDSLPRAAKRIKRDWRDIAEAVIGLGAGDVIVLDSQKNIVMRIPNVPFLWFFRQDIDHILEVLATTEVEDIAAVMEEDDLA